MDHLILLNVKTFEKYECVPFILADTFGTFINNKIVLYWPEPDTTLLDSRGEFMIQNPEDMFELCDLDESENILEFPHKVYFQEKLMASFYGDLKEAEDYAKSHNNKILSEVKERFKKELKVQQ
jgi:hypothetical protein